MTTNIVEAHSASVIRYCKTHSAYYIGPGHESCDSFSLTWNEVLFYLNKLERLKGLMRAFREETLI